MSARRQIERATRRATVRDRKRRTRMAVTGRSVLQLSKLITQTPKKSKLSRRKS